MKKILLLALLATQISLVRAQFIKDVSVDAQIGYNIGGTMPLGMPASIRGLNSYTPQLNPQVGIKAEKPLADKWGVEAGVILDRKAMKTDAQVKGYHMTMSRGGEAIEGYFTGNVVTEVGTWTMSVPVEMTFKPTDKLKVYAGPYVGWNFSRNFEGYAYDGYIRNDTPTGERIELGSTAEERGEYNFNDDMRAAQWGINAGVSYKLTHGLGVYANLAWGMSGAFNKDFRTIEQKMYPIYGTIGLNYKLK